MNLELIIGEAVAGFGVGFALGRYLDRRVEYGLVERLENPIIMENLENPIIIKDLENLPKEVLEKKEQIIKDIKKVKVGFRLKPSLIASLMAGYGNLFTGQDLTSIAAGFGITPLTTYLGIKTGEFLSKRARYRAKLKPKEQEFVNQYLKEFKQNIINSDDGGIPEELKEKALQIEKIYNRKKNISLLKKLYEETANIAKYSIKYILIKQFLEAENEGIGFLPPNDLFCDEVNAFILHEKSIYLLQLGMDAYKRIKGKKGKPDLEIIAPSMDTEELEWDGSIDGIMKITNDYKDRASILVNSNQEFPLSMKTMAALNAFADIYSGKREFEETMRRQPKN